MESALPQELKTIFAHIDARSVFREDQIGDTAWDYIETHRPLADTSQAAAHAEWFAFTLTLDPLKERGIWGTYFCPLFISHTDNGGVTSHALESLSPRIVAYWAARAEEAVNPILRARYADVAWELAPLIEGAERDIRTCRTAIDAYIAVTSTAIEIHRAIKYLIRALNLAFSINDDDRVQKVVDALFSMADRGDTAAQIQTRAILFGNIFNLRRRIKLTVERQQQLIDAMEASLRHAVADEVLAAPDHFAAQRYAEPLLQLYRSRGSNDDVIRVTKLLGAAIEKASNTIEPILATVRLQEAQVAYARAGLQKDSDRVLIAMKGKGREAKEGLASHIIKQEIPADDIEAFLDQITQGGCEASYKRIVGIFLPQSKALRKRLDTIKEKCPLMSLFPISLLGDDQVIAQVGSAATDKEGRLVYELAQDINFWAIFLMQALERVFVEYDLSPEQFVDLLYRTPLWGIERYQILKNGIRHYYEGDYIAAVHVLIPQIEHALRMLLIALRRPTNVHNPKLVAYQEKDLGTILADESLRTLLSEDVVRYFRALLTDQRGWNLRNRLSHGLYNSYFFQRQIADRVIHMMMVVSCIRPVENVTNETESSNRMDS